MTILIPAKNAEKTIKRAIMSAANQTCCDWDMQILIDKNTTDETYARAVSVRGKLRSKSRIKINTSSHGGLPAVYKELIERAEPRDDILGFLDSDDRLVPKAVKVMLSVYKNSPFLGHVWSQFVFNTTSKKGYSKHLAGNKQSAAFANGWWGSHHFRTFRKSVYLGSPYPLQMDLPIATDYNLALVLAATDCPAQFVDTVLYIYYRNPDGITVTRADRQKGNYLEMRRRFARWYARRQLGI